MGAEILSLHEAILQFGPTKRNGRRVVFTNGCFDLLHPGHIETLEKARNLGDALVVGVNSDRSVRKMKGAGRPILPERERAEILAALECVDGVVIFDEPTPRETITALLPALFAIVAPPGSTNIPLTVGAIAFGITIIAAIAAMTARETYRISINDLGTPGAVPMAKAEYDRKRAEAVSGVAVVPT